MIPVGGKEYDVIYGMVRSLDIDHGKPDATARAIIRFLNRRERRGTKRTTKKRISK